MRVFEAGDTSPFFVAVANGSGVFATGQRAATVDTTSCDDVYGAETVQ